MEDQPKTVLVRGSTSGIGLAIAKRFAEAGYLVGVHGIETAEEATQALEAVAKVARHRPVYFAANLANYDESAHLPETVIAELGHIDVLVNNAGIQKVAPIDEFDFADFSRIVTKSSAAVVWMPIVASNCALVAPSFTAIATPWMISPASGPIMCAPTTRWLAASTTSFMKIFSSLAPSVCLSARYEAL